jgi:hypothetical protein
VTQLAISHYEFVAFTVEFPDFDCIVVDCDEFVRVIVKEFNVLATLVWLSG